MSEAFIGQVMLFGFSYAPYNYAYCNGASVYVSQNPALYSLIGSTFGGSGSGAYQFFNLPNLSGLTIAGTGVGPGSNINWYQGLTKGAERVTLNGATYPSHSHTISQQAVVATEGVPIAGHCISSVAQGKGAAPYTAADTYLSANFLSPSGQVSVAPHENQQANLTLNLCIALEGEYPYFE